MSADKRRTIVACVPVSMHPDFPATATYSPYTQVPCPACQQPMLLGGAGRQLVDHGADMLCMVCLLEKAQAAGVDPKDIVLHTLDDPDAGKA